MCGRFALAAPKAELITLFGLDDCVDFPVRYNIPPGTEIPVIRQSPEGKRVLHLLRWGLVPHWAKEPSIGAKLNNARGESVAEKPSFRDAFKRRRCLIPADGFYEWKAEGKTKQPYYISLKSGKPMAMAGLWESWKAPDGNILRTVCVVTTAANTVMKAIHDRMPVNFSGSPENSASSLSLTSRSSSCAASTITKRFCRADGTLRHVKGAPMRAWDFDSGDILEALDTLDAEGPPFERLFTKGNRYTITKIGAKL